MTSAVRVVAASLERRIGVLGLAVLAAACSPASSVRAPERSGNASGRIVFDVERACVPSGPERCMDARDDNCNGIIDEGCGLPTGPVQFVIAWDAPTADVDLRVTDPNGEMAEVGRTLASGLVKQRDCPGREEPCRGQNLENVFLDGNDPPRGTYRVRVVLEDLGDEAPPVRVRLGARVGPRTYSFELRLDGPDAAYEAEFDL
ncbi:MAG: hypothetical protein DIU78_011715 [Pseudomonadota bacterium]